MNNPYPPPQKKKRTVPLWAAAVVAVFALVIGVASASSEASESSDPVPTVTTTITETPEAQPAPTVTEVVEVAQSVPEPCLLAIKEADGMMNISADFAYLMADHFDEDFKFFEAISSGNFGEVEGYIEHLSYVTEETNRLTDRIEANDYASYAQECNALR